MQYMHKRKLADLPEGADSPLNTAVVTRDKATLDMVAAAVKHNQTLLAFQPVMQARAPFQPAFYEGLIRVLDATGRVIPARDFMPLVEDTELGRELDCEALEKGLRTLAQNPDVRLSINMSARSIGYKRWMRVLDRHLKRAPLLGERLILELTETSTMSLPELVVDFMDQLQDRGISFALDHFGTGQSAVRYFKDFFFDAVKIDGQFVRGIHQNPDNQAVVRSLLATAKNFEMLTIAEMVEAEQDARFLVSIGVDCLQGYLFGAPTIRPPWIPQKTAQASA